MKSIRLLFSILIAATLLGLRVSHAQYEAIESFTSNIQINSEGTIDVTEKIIYTFPDQRHGIIREIPMSKTNDDGNRFFMDAEIIEVLANGKRATFNDESSGGNFIIRIGDANRTITGTHEYKITYRVSGALTYFTDHDELYWNITGNEWPVPILASNTTITIDPALTPEFFDAICYTGGYGSSEQTCLVTKNSSSSITITTSRALDSYEGLTVVTKFPTGLVEVLEPRKDNSAAVIAVILLLVEVALPVYLIIRALRIRKRLPEEKIVVSAWFDPPRLPSGRFLTAGETGTLVDRRVDIRDISGTLIQLAQKGYIKIREEKEKSGFIIQKPIFTFVMQKDWKDDDKLTDHEKELLEIIFLNSTEVSTEKIGQRIGFSSKLNGVMKTIGDQLVTDGLLMKNVMANRDIWNAVAIISLFFFNPLLIIAALLSKSAIGRTSIGGDAIAKTQSLKNFIVTQDEQYKFQAKNKMMFEKLLPFAVAFGVEKIWIERFKDLVNTPPDWYEGTSGRAFNYALLSSSFNDSVNAATQMSSSRSSSGFSSGFSGGGFSGGGGGGGGGGSW